MPKAPTELVIIEMTQALLVWTLNHIAKFPRSHRYGLGLRLEQRLSTLLDQFIEAKFTRERLAILTRCNLHLEQLRFDFRTAKDVRCLSIDSCGSASRFVNEIGTNLGQWIKSLNGAANEKPQQPLAQTGEFSQPADRGPERFPR